MLNNIIKNSPAGPVLEATSRVRVQRVKAAARRRWLSAGLFASLVFCPCVMAQERQKPAASAPLVTASATDERLRLVAPGSVVQLRLEVYGVSGQKVFDTEVRGGNVLDWHLRDGAGERLAAGSYTCLLTIKSLSGKLSQRVGLLAIGDTQTLMRPLEAAQLSAAQQQAIGPLEGNAAFTVLQPSEQEAVTAVAHDGESGKVVSTSGALTFGTGDIFKGTEIERIRITPDGRVGIGTNKPTAALDVQGMIRARGGIRFDDGTALTSTGKTGRTAADGSVTPNAAGTGTQGRLARWADNAGTLDDSVVTQLNNNIGVGTTTPGSKLTVAGPLEVGAASGAGSNPTFVNPNNLASYSQLLFYPASGANVNSSFSIIPRGTGQVNNRAQLSLFNSDRIANPNNFEFASFRARDGDFVIGTGKVGTGQNLPLMLASGILTNSATNNGQLYLSPNGNVGVGTTTPSAKLSVQATGDPALQINHTGTAGNPALWLQQDGTTRAYMWWDKVGNRLNLGTPTTNPIISFHNDGRIKIPPTTRYKSLHGSAFRPQSQRQHVQDELNPYAVYRDRGLSGRFSPYRCETCNDEPFWLAPVEFPVGAVITELCMSARDTEDSIDITADIGRTNLLSGGASLIARTFTSGGSPNVQNVCINSHEVVNNEFYVYWVRIRMESGELIGVRIKYQVTQLP